MLIGVKFLQSEIVSYLFALDVRPSSSRRKLVVVLIFRNEWPKTTRENQTMIAYKG